MESRVPVMRRLAASIRRGIRKDGPLPDLRRLLPSCQPEFEHGTLFELERGPVKLSRRLSEATSDSLPIEFHPRIPSSDGSISIREASSRGLAALDFPIARRR